MPFGDASLVRLAAQSLGRVGSPARRAPDGGQPEPVRQFDVHPLRKSLEDIRAEAFADGSHPGNLTSSLTGLSSGELKAWMINNPPSQFSWLAFIKSLTPTTSWTSPEFFKHTSRTVPDVLRICPPNRSSRPMIASSIRKNRRRKKNSIEWPVLALSPSLPRR